LPWLFIPISIHEISSWIRARIANCTGSTTMNSTALSVPPIAITARMPDVVRLAITAVVLIAITRLPSSAAPPISGVLHAPMEHLRSGEQREWSAFPQSSRGDTITLPFTATPNASEYTLALRQKDVADKRWAVSLNGKRLGS